VTPPRPFELPLAICVDDYGLHAGVNVAAIALAGAGRVSAISAMVGGPA
jgi:chitin disaccharide deacetylase